MIEHHTEFAKIIADVRQHFGERQLQHPAETIRAQQLTRARDERIDVGLLVARGGIRGQVGEHARRRASQLLAHQGFELVRERAHVVAAVTVLRKRQLLAAQAEIPQPGADGEDVHLPSGIVDVVLARDLKPHRGENVRERRAVGRLASMTHMQRPGRVRGHEFHQHPLALAEPAFTVSATERMDTREFARVRLGRQVEVDESGPCHLDAREQGARRERGHDGGRKLARIPARRLCQAQREVGGELAVLVVAGALDDHRGGGGHLREHAPGELAQRGQQQLLEFLLQEVRDPRVWQARKCTRSAAATADRRSS